ncbi:uncharacterized protein LOC130282099 [Hyla sarda]|uniref:uncharacterized protein LOC130282099 n=1 Tax=Hyla sarda TaxID=327740 RepID=UPI0024C2FF24|nr:uncharacterized protein LOC130282099 [Hyla sarda]
MVVLPLVIFTNVIQIQYSGYIVHFGFLSMNYMLEPSTQTPANVNLGFVPSDPPSYSQATNYGPPPPFQQPAPSPPPPPYPCLAPTSSSDVSNEWKDYLQPPPYSE